MPKSPNKSSLYELPPPAVQCLAIGAPRWSANRQAMEVTGRTAYGRAVTVRYPLPLARAMAADLAQAIEQAERPTRAPGAPLLKPSGHIL